jgi:hypothetical protein
MDGPRHQLSTSSFFLFCVFFSWFFQLGFFCFFDIIDTSIVYRILFTKTKCPDLLPPHRRLQRQLQQVGEAACMCHSHLRLLLRVRAAAPRPPPAAARRPPAAAALRPPAAARRPLARRRCRPLLR